MSPGRFEYRDFDVGGIPPYAQRGATTDNDTSADFTAYGEDPDGVLGVSAQGTGNELQDPDAERGGGDNLADEGTTQSRFGDLAEDEPAADGGVAADGAREDDEDLLDDEVVIPAQSAAADTEGENAAGEAEDHDPDDDAATEDAAHPEAVDSTDKMFDDETATPDEVAVIIAAEYGLGIDEARRLVAETQAALDTEPDDEHDETGQVDRDTDPDEAEADEHEGETETVENASSRDRVVKFLRRVAAKTGEVATSEATIFAEGARALSDDFRDWYGDKDERSRERALSRVKKDIAKRVRKWEKFEKHRGNTGVQAPRGYEDR